MIEQPPEKSEMEIAAEIAAAEQQQMSAPNRAHGCLRMLIWCAPTFVVALIVAVIGPFLYNTTIFVYGTTFIILSLAAIFGIGYFDGMLSQKTYSHTESDRNRNIRIHALKFLGWQLVIIPAIIALLYGSCMLLLLS